MDWSRPDTYARERADRRYEIDRERIDRIAELEEQVTRLQNAYHEALIEIDWWPDTWDTMTDDEQCAEHRANGLLPGDLDPVN